MKQAVTIIIVVATGLIVLGGYFLPIPILIELRTQLVHWAVILAGIAVLVGVFNLLSVHWEKLRKREKGGGYSLLLILSLLATLILGLVLGPEHAAVHLLFNGIMLPVEASLMAILAVTLVYASIRLLRQRADLMAVLFLFTAVLILLSTAPLSVGRLPGLSDSIRGWILKVPVTAGARGLLLGMALGTLTTGIRILFTADRPYGDK